MVDIETIGVGFDTSGLTKGTAALKDNAKAANTAADAADKTTASTGRLSTGFGSLKAILATLGLGVLAREFVQVADAMSLLDARLKIATNSALEFNDAQKQIYKIAQANNVGLQETAKLYTKLSDPVKALGGSTREVGAIVDAFATSMRVGGASAQEASSATLQFAQAMGSGKLSGDEFRSMAEASPRFMKALAEGMGVPTGALKEMSTEGKLTADIVGNALIKELSKLKEEAKGIPDTVGGSFTRMKNDIAVAVNEINKASGLTLGIAGLGEELGKVIPIIQSDLTGAFKDVRNWIDANRVALGDVWESSKNILAEVYEIGKLMVSVVGFTTDWAIQSGAVKNVLDNTHLLIAGLKDGVSLLGGAFATIGSIIFKFVLSPIAAVQTGLAAIMEAAGRGDLAEGLRKSAGSLREFAGAGAKYGDEIANSFARGDTAVNRLKNSLESASLASKNRNSQIGKDAMGSIGVLDSSNAPFKKLKPLAGTGDDKGAGAKISEYTRMEQEIKKVTAAQEQELQYGGKLTASAKFQFDEMQKINFALQTKKISQSESVKLIELTTAATAKMIEVERQAYDKEALKRYTETLDKQTESVTNSLAAMYASNEQLRLENETIGLSTTAMNALILARQDAAIADKQLELISAQNSETDAKRINQIEQEIALLQTKRALTGAGQTSKAEVEAKKIAAEDAKKYETEQVKLWSEINDKAESVFMDIAKNGKGAFKNLESELKNGVLKLLYDATVKPFIIKLATDATGLDFSKLLGGDKSGGGSILDILGKLTGGKASDASSKDSRNGSDVQSDNAVAETADSLGKLGEAAGIANAGIIAQTIATIQMGIAAVVAAAQMAVAFVIANPVASFFIAVGVAIASIFSMGAKEAPTVLNDLDLFNQSLAGLPFQQIAYSSDEAAQGLRDVLYGLDNASPTMKKLAGETISLSIELLKATGDIAGAANLARNLGTRGMSKAEIEVYDYNEALKAQIEAARAGAQASQAAAQAEEQLAKTRWDLAGKLNILLGRTTQKEFDRATQLAATSDAASIEMLNLIFKMEDLTAAVDASYAKLERSIAAEKKLAETRLKSATDLAAILKTTKDAITPSLDRASAQSQIAMYVALAKAGGVLPSAAALKPALDSIAKPSMDLFKTFEEYAIDQARTANDISDLSEFADQQVSEAQQTIDRLDSQLETAKQALDALKGVDTSVVAVGDAVKAFEASMLTLANAKAGAGSFNFTAPSGSSGGGGGGYSGGGSSSASTPTFEDIAGQSNKDIVAAYREYYKRNPDESGYENFVKSQLKGDKLMQAILAASSANKNGADYKMAVSRGYNPDSPTEKFLKSILNPSGGGSSGSGAIPEFANGGDHTGGLRFVGERGVELEATGASRITNTESLMSMLKNGNNNASLIAEVKALREEVIGLRAETRAIANHSGKTASYLDDVINGERTINTEVAA